MKRNNSIKRKYTKRKRKTNNKRNKRKNKTTKKILRGGDNPGYDCLNHTCVYNAINGTYPSLDYCLSNCKPAPPPPPPPPSPPDINGLKLITIFQEIRPRKLYILTDGKYPYGDNVFLYLPSLRPKPNEMNKELMQEEVDYHKMMLAQAQSRSPSRVGEWLVLEGFECTSKLCENIIKKYDDGQNYDNYEYLTFRMTNSLSSSHNNLCISQRESNKWFNHGDVLDFNKPFFEYMKTKYTIYEFETWPKEIPRPPLELTSSSADIFDISGDPWVDWEELASMEANTSCPPGWYFDRESKECAEIPSTYYG